MYFKHFILGAVSLVISCAPQTHQQTTDLPILNYKLTPVLDDASGNNLIIELNFIGDTDGKTEVVLGQAWADEQAPWERFKDIKLSSEGQTLPFNQTSGRLTVSHEANTPLKLTYHLNQNDGRDANGDSGFYYAPVLNDNIYHLIGYTSLALPVIETRNEAGQRAARVRLNWDIPENWQSAASFDSQAKTNIPFDDVFQTAFMAGDFNVNSRPIGDKQLKVIMIGAWSFSEAQFADKLSRILTALNTSWHDSPVDYQVSLLPLPPTPNASSFTGTGLNHAFAAVSTENVDLDFLTTFLTHEMTHDWIPNRLGHFPSCPDENIDCAAGIYWFSEGFTDFYTLALLRKYQLISDEIFIKKTNENLREYYLSPARNVSNIKIQKDFWTNLDIERQPYLRGFFLALNWNHEVMIKTKGKETLFDALRSLKDKAAASETVPELTQNYLAKHFSGWIGRDLTSDLEAYIINGDIIMLMSLA